VKNERIATELVKLAKAVVSEQKTAASDVMMERDVSEAIENLQKVLKRMQQTPSGFPGALALRIEAVRKDVAKLLELSVSLNS